MNGGQENVFTVIQETRVLGKSIKMYGSIESPWFLARDVAEWIDYSKNPNGSRQVSKMLKTVDEDEKLVVKLLLPDDSQVREHSFLTEDGLYECCMKSTKPIAKQMKKEIKKYLKSIRLTGSAIVDEQKTVDYYFSSLSEETKVLIFNELQSKNKELQEFYDDLINTEGLMDMNTVAKELGIGEYTLFAYLRGKNVLFYNNDDKNIPYERFRKEGKFEVKETPCRDGKYRSVTYATKKGLEYIRKQLRKDGYYNVEVTA